MRNPIIALSIMINHINKELFPEEKNSCHVVGSREFRVENQLAFFLPKMESNRNKFFDGVSCASGIAYDADIYIIASSDLEEKIKSFSDVISSEKFLLQNAMGAVWHRVQEKRKLAMLGLSFEVFNQKAQSFNFSSEDYAEILKLMALNSQIIDVIYDAVQSVCFARQHLIQGHKALLEAGETTEAGSCLFIDRIFTYERYGIVAIALTIHLMASQVKSLEFLKRAKDFAEEKLPR